MFALIFAAGLGTRLRPLTDTMPKALVPIGGQTLLEYQIDSLKRAGVTDIIINVHHFGEQIIDFVNSHDNFGCHIMISDERDLLLDTGGGLLKAWQTYAAGEPILAINVDILSSINLRTVMDAYNPDELGILVVKARQTQRYLCFDDANRLVGWTNIATGEVKGKDGKHLAFSGLQVLSPQVLPLLQEFAQEKGPKFSVIDFYLHVVASQAGVLRALPLDVPLLDVGKIDQLSKAEKFAENLKISAN